MVCPVLRAWTAMPRVWGKTSLSFAIRFLVSKFFLRPGPFRTPYQIPTTTIMSRSPVEKSAKTATIRPSKSPRAKRVWARSGFLPVRTAEMDGILGAKEGRRSNNHRVKDQVRNPTEKPAEPNPKNNLRLAGIITGPPRLFEVIPFLRFVGGFFGPHPGCPCPG